MNGTGEQRPQVVPAPGKRVVLLIPRADPLPKSPDSVGDRKLAMALQEIEAGGWCLVAVMEPDQHLEALAMVVDDMADVVVVTRPEHFPVIRFVSELNGAPSNPRDRRTRAIPRRDHPWRTGPAVPGRRARVIGAGDEPATTMVVTGPPEPAEQRRPRLIEKTEEPPAERRTKVIRRTA